MQKKFSKINTEHSDTIETKFMYRLKLNENPSTKKRTYNECEEDGFMELLSVEEEENFRKSEEDINDLSNATAVVSLK